MNRRVLAPLLVLALSTTALAQDARWETRSLAALDVPVTDQNGRTLRFYSDLVRDRTVAIDFIFTTCTTICRPMTAIFRSVQGNAAAGGIELISITLDPLHDTPSTLRRYASDFQAKPGWTFVTGDKAVIDGLLKELGAFTSDKSGHTPLFLIGNDRTRRWTRISGFTPAGDVVKLLGETKEGR